MALGYKSPCKECQDPPLRHHGDKCNTFRVKETRLYTMGFNDTTAPQGDELEGCKCLGYVPSDNLEWVDWYHDKQA